AHGDHFGTTLDKLFDLDPHLAQVDVKIFQDVGADTGALLDQAKKNVLGADVLMVEALGLLVRQGHHLPGAIRESFKHGSDLRMPGTSRSGGWAGSSGASVPPVIPVPRVSGRSVHIGRLPVQLHS